MLLAKNGKFPRGPVEQNFIRIKSRSQLFALAEGITQLLCEQGSAHADQAAAHQIKIQVNGI